MEEFVRKNPWLGLESYKEGEISHLYDINIVWQYNIIQKAVINAVFAENFLPCEIRIFTM